MRLRRSKYGAVKTEVDGILFASKKEARRYGELKLLEKASEIVDLTLQPRFDIHVENEPICTYVGDFYYITREGERVVEDAKGMKTPMYRLKRKLMKAVHGITIREV